jgi:hypothetical protein
MLYEKRSIVIGDGDPGQPGVNFSSFLMKLAECIPGELASTMKILKPNLACLEKWRYG